MSPEFIESALVFNIKYTTGEPVAKITTGYILTILVIVISKISEISLHEILEIYLDLLLHVSLKLLEF